MLAVAFAFLKFFSPSDLERSCLLYTSENGNPKKKYYCLDMFPYPSGNGLHVGHWRGYVISDVWSRYKLLQGYYIIHPMGWDAFGLPAENYAIKMGTHPAKSTAANIANIKRQINEISALYDWDMEVNTTDPDFYKWTQWIFVKTVSYTHLDVYKRQSLHRLSDLLPLVS